ncbi:glycosyltransferase family 4 protein [Stenotrophomonas maltophilia]|uniref:glycosyltransferase family 4 protein n=1 Tax=Stenotrophomonas maltophilia TaxID=40324 RepID=UPI00159ED6F8|nr:glycosyltransferase family 4 protein [Stenotrophomonas maltophilia]
MLCKRQYTGRDLIDDQYGRLWEIPEALARRGHTVSGITLSYRHRDTGDFPSPAGVRWRSINALSLETVQLKRSVRRLHQQHPVDVLLTSSDAPCTVLGGSMAKHIHAPHVADLYDNYESFGLTRLPGLRSAFRRACADATAISAVTHALANQMRSTLSTHVPMHVIGNGVRRDLFHPIDRRTCRETLGLPIEARLIGCAGALDQSRGIEDLFRAFHALSKVHSDIHLVIAGPRDASPHRYLHPRIIDLGVINWQLVPLLINSLDVSVVCNRDSAFGCFCYPMKLAESIACGVPIVASDVGDTRLIGGDTLLTYAPGNVNELVDAIELQLQTPPSNAVLGAIDWEERAIQMEALLVETTHPNRL